MEQVQWARGQHRDVLSGNSPTGHAVWIPLSNEDPGAFNPPRAELSEAKPVIGRFGTTFANLPTPFEGCLVSIQRRPPIGNKGRMPLPTSLTSSVSGLTRNQRVPMPEQVAGADGDGRPFRAASHDAMAGRDPRLAADSNSSSYGTGGGCGNVVVVVGTGGGCGNVVVVVGTGGGCGNVVVVVGTGGGCGNVVVTPLSPGTVAVGVEPGGGSFLPSPATSVVVTGDSLAGPCGTEDAVPGAEESVPSGNGDSATSPSPGTDPLSAVSPPRTAPTPRRRQQERAPMRSEGIYGPCPDGRPPTPLNVEASMALKAKQRRSPTASPSRTRP